MLYTSNFNNVKYIQQPVFIPISIAQYNAKYADVKLEYKKLAPCRELLHRYKNNKISESEYTVEFLKQLQKMDATSVIEDFRKLGGGKSVGLICHCGIKNFCHRHLVAEWIEKSTGRNIVEFKHEKCIRKNGKLLL